MAPETIQQYREELKLIYGLATAISLVDVPAMIAAAEHAESVGPFVDPTAYRRNGRALREDLAALRAARPLWELGQKLLAAPPPDQQTPETDRP